MLELFACSAVRVVHTRTMSLNHIAIRHYCSWALTCLRISRVSQLGPRPLSLEKEANSWSKVSDASAQTGTRLCAGRRGFKFVDLAHQGHSITTFWLHRGPDACIIVDANSPCERGLANIRSLQALDLSKQVKLKTASTHPTVSSFKPPTVPSIDIEVWSIYYVPVAPFEFGGWSCG